MGQQMSGTLTIEAMDGGYSGSFATDFGTLPLTDFTVDGTAVTFSGTFSQFALAFTLAFAGEGFTGDVSMGDMGSGAITGVTR